MLNLLRSFFGVLFFIGCFGIVMIKNTPNKYNLIISQQSNLIWASLADELQKGEWKFEEKNPVVFADQMNQLKTTAPKTIIFKLPTPYSFDLKEIWKWNESKKIITVNYQYELNFLSKLYFTINPELNKKIKDFGEARLLKTLEKIQSKFNQHRSEYLGEMPLPMTYYLAIEGKSPWKDLEAAVFLGHEKIKTFGTQNNIPLQEKSFIVYPSLGEEVVQWRAAIAVDQFYKTNSAEIRCRRYKGGNTLALLHKGPDNFLRNSWNRIKDSLNNRQQNYPFIQQSIKNIDQTKNPLNWETILYIPIQ